MSYRMLYGAAHLLTFISINVSILCKPSIHSKLWEDKLPSN